MVVNKCQIIILFIFSNLSLQSPLSFNAKVTLNLLFKLVFLSFPEEIHDHKALPAPQIVVGPPGPTGPVGPTGMNISDFVPMN